MSNPNKLQLDKREMFKCESCQGFHSADESEIVLIKIIKGKNCELKSPVAPVIMPVRNTSIDFQQNPGIINNEPPAVVPSKPKKAIIPPGIASMMIEPGHPLFESHGAKETRKL